MKFLSMCFVVLLSMNAFAVSDQQIEEQWARRVWKTIHSNNYENIDVELGSLTASQRLAVDQAAQDLFDIWPDTILEGDYSLDPAGSLKVIYINKVVNNKGEAIAYQFGFDHEAYYTGDCEIDWEAIENGTESYEDQLVSKGCGHGTIVGHGYISPDFKFSMRDDDNIEDFSD